MPESLSSTAQALHKTLSSLTAFIPAPVVHEQLANPHAARITASYWYGSLLFADLSGFTKLSERLSTLGKQGAEEISLIIINLFTSLLNEVKRFGGQPLKFGGDALMVFFDAKQLGEAHAELAASAALAMQQRMQSFANVQTPVGTFSLLLRIGVHSGRILASQVGDREHVELVISGTTVNLVASAQEEAEPGEVLISNRTYELIGTAPSLQVVQRGEHFYVLQQLQISYPNIELSDPVPPLPATIDANTISQLEQQIAALKPYLMPQIPKRYIEQNSELELGEFRIVSVLFVHYSSVGTIIDILNEDPELAARLLNVFYKRIQAVIHSYGGVINKVDTATSGNKIMALFGAPVAHGDDALRAVRCALELTHIIDQSNREIAEILSDYQATLNKSSDFEEYFAFQQRIGISTGTVFAGLVGAKERHEYTVMGANVNLAARLMGAAEVNTVVLAPNTASLVQRDIDVRALEPISLKGFSQPVTPYIATNVRYESRERPTFGTYFHTPPLIARDEELALCLKQSRAALEESGRVVAIVGGPGIGKSRFLEALVQELVRDSSLQTFDIYVGESQLYEQSLPYGAVRGLLRYILKIDSLIHQNSVAISKRIHKQVQHYVPHLLRFSPLLGDMLGVALPETALTSQLTPQQRHDRAQELVESLLLTMYKERGLLVMIDDLHWADPSSLELLERLAHQAHDSRILMLLSYRHDQDLKEPWNDLPNTRRLHLKELSLSASKTLAQAMLQAPLPDEIVPLLERTQGNPFFIEEMLHDLVATGALVNHNQLDGSNFWQLARPIDSLEVPDSVEGILMAQLDRLDDHFRELIQIASVIGRKFMYQILQGIFNQKELLDAGLQYLASSEILLSEEAGPDKAYLFRHSLVRDVAYESILYSRRRILHQRVAELIISIYGPAAVEQLPLIAQHYLLAEQWDKAFEYHWRAGHSAQQRYANQEALSLFNRALEISKHVQQPERVIKIHEHIGSLHMLQGNFDKALASFQHTLELLMPHADQYDEDVARLHRQVATVYERLSDFDEASNWLDRAISHTPQLGSHERTRCYLLRAGLLQRQGKLRECLQWAARGLLLAEALDNREDQAKAYKLLGGTYCSLGDLDSAIQPTYECLQFYTSVHNLEEQAGAHINLGNIYYDLGRWQEAREQYEAAVQITSEIGNSFEQALAHNNLGEVLRNQGNSIEAIEEYTKALMGWQNSPFQSALVLMNIGASSIQQGDLDAAEKYLDQSDKLFNEVGNDSFASELLRYKAELALASGHYSEALSICIQSIQIAEQQDAVLENACSQRLFGRILLQTGDLDKAASALQTSLNLLQDIKSELEHARTLMWIADLHFRRDEVEAAKELIQESCSVFEGLGAKYDLHQLDEILRFHGTRIGRKEICDSGIYS
jgi:Predicted ATPase